MISSILYAQISTHFYRQSIREVYIEKSIIHSRVSQHTTIYFCIISWRCSYIATQPFSIVFYFIFVAMTTSIKYINTKFRFKTFSALICLQQPLVHTYIYADVRFFIPCSSQPYICIQYLVPSDVSNFQHTRSNVMYLKISLQSIRAQYIYVLFSYLIIFIFF